VDVANNIANLMNFVMTCMFYMPIIPQAVPIALIGTFLNYWAYKFMLLRRHKSPELFSDLMAIFFSNFMPWIIFAQAVAYYTFLYKINSQYSSQDSSLSLSLGSSFSLDKSLSLSLDSFKQ
jgi:hypothetical protein